MARNRTREDFKRVMLPHLGAAYNLARWLMRNSHDAEDAVQESFLKAFKSFDQMTGEDGAAWLLRIVRNTCMTLLKQQSNRGKIIRLDAAASHSDAVRPDAHIEDKQPLPDAQLIAKSESRFIHNAIGQLSTEYREVLVLREFEEMSYQQIADIADIPIGTVMSRLSRARKKLRALLLPDQKGGQRHEM